MPQIKLRLEEFQVVRLIVEKRFKDVILHPSSITIILSEYARLKPIFSDETTSSVTVLILFSHSVSINFFFWDHSFSTYAQFSEKLMFLTP